MEKRETEEVGVVSAPEKVPNRLTVFLLAFLVDLNIMINKPNFGSTRDKLRARSKWRLLLRPSIGYDDSRS